MSSVAALLVGVALVVRALELHRFVLYSSHDLAQQQVMFWMLGSPVARRGQQVPFVLGVVGRAACYWWWSRRLNALLLMTRGAGDVVGIDHPRTRIALFLVSSAMVAAIVSTVWVPSASGPVVLHVARMFVVSTCGKAFASILVGAVPRNVDLVSRVICAFQRGASIGVVTAMLGTRLPLVAVLPRFCARWRTRHELACRPRVGCRPVGDADRPDVTIDVRARPVVALVGPNGGAARRRLPAPSIAPLRPVDGIGLSTATTSGACTAEAARRIAVVAREENPIGFDFTASEVAATGRIPHKRGRGRLEGGRRLVMCRESLEVRPVGLAHRAVHGDVRRRAAAHADRPALCRSRTVLPSTSRRTTSTSTHQLDVLHNSASSASRPSPRCTTSTRGTGATTYVPDRVVVAGGPAPEALTAERISDDVPGATEFVHPVTGYQSCLTARRRHYRDRAGWDHALYRAPRRTA